MKAEVIETGKIVNVVSIVDMSDGHLISYFDQENRKEYSHCELNFSIITPTEKTSAQPIDWEQRRYEIAKDIVANSFSMPIAKASMVSYIHDCVQYADLLIEELKRK